ncbi:hypothetical protein ACS0TY_036268 [Phlomoides rotata]
MRKISGQVVSTKVTTLSRAAEIVSRFAAVDNGSSSAVSLYLHRTAEAFNNLVQFHDKRSKLKKMESRPNLQTNVAEKSLSGGEGKDSENKVRKKDKKRFNNLGETNLRGDETEDVEISVKKKKKKRKSDDSDMKEKSSRKKKNRDEAVADL